MAALIKNFRNRCTGKRSILVYFDLKPPADEEFRDHVFFPRAIIEDHILERINDPSIVLYLYLWVRKTELARKNQEFSIPAPDLIEQDTQARGVKIPESTVRRYLGRLKDLGLLDFKNSGAIR